MKYSKPEIEILNLSMLDVIATSGTEDEMPGTTENGTPPMPFSTGDYWGN